MILRRQSVSPLPSGASVERPPLSPPPAKFPKCSSQCGAGCPAADSICLIGPRPKKQGFFGRGWSRVSVAWSDRRLDQYR